MPTFHYRLAALLEQKETHKQNCEKQLAECRAERRRAKESLMTLQEQQRQLEQDLRQLRATPLPAEARGEDWQNRAGDVLLLGQRVEAAKDDVFSQQLRIEEIEQQVTKAAAALQEAARDVETLEKHRARSERQFFAALERKQEQEQEEIAAAMYENRRRA